MREAQTRLPSVQGTR